MSINILTGLFGRKAALKVLPWLFLYLGLSVANKILTSAFVWGYAMGITKSYSLLISYIVVALLSATIGCLYWKAVNEAVNRIDTFTSEKKEEPITQGKNSEQPSFTKKQVEDILTKENLKLEKIFLVQKEKGTIPQLQVTPVDIEERFNLTGIKVHVVNYSEYAAKNIILDVKLGNNYWIREAHKTTGKDLNKLFKIDTNDKKTKKMIEDYYNKPLYDELPHGRAVDVYLFDENKDFLLKQHVYFHYSDGREIPISPEDSHEYKGSQGWKEELVKLTNSKNEQPVIILIRIIWEDESGRRYEKIVEYNLNCTQINTTKSYTFLPTGKVITNYD